jgi:hypothetical protein
MVFFLLTIPNENRGLLKGCWGLMEKQINTQTKGSRTPNMKPYKVANLGLPKWISKPLSFYQ